MASGFDIGPAGDLAIFTNNNDDMFNISGDIGPNFILDQGHDRGIADINASQSLVPDVIADMPNETPVDFINYNPGNTGNTGKAKTVADLDIGGMGGMGGMGGVNSAISSRIPRQKMDSMASDATIEAEPIKQRGSDRSGSKSHKDNRSSDRDAQVPPFPQKPQLPKVLSHPPAMDDQKEADTPPNIGMNMGFDDLLDGRKLKPAPDILDDAASIGGESQSTIKHGGRDDYSGGGLSEPNSPDFRALRPSAQSPPDSPMPSTFQRDRERRKMERGSSSMPTSMPEELPAQPVYDEVPKYINEDDEKMDLLLKLRSLEERGKITLSKHYNIKSSIDEIRMEYRNQTSMLETQASVNFMRKGLIFCTSGLEYMNRRFDPVGAKLDGWGESIMENIMDYDGIFERLHNKYKGSMEMEPEMELLFALGGSAFQFHLSQTFFKSAIPQLGQVLRENPAVIQGFMNVAQEAARRNQGGPPTHMGMQGPPMGYPQGGMGGGPMPANDAGVGVGPMGGMQSPNIDFGTLLGQVGITSGVLSDFAKTMGNPPPPPQATRDYREPPVNDLYRQMVQQQQQNQDDALSVSSERSIDGNGARAVITPIPTSRRGGGGNVIKLI